MRLLVALCLFGCVTAHSWMSCPPSFDTNPSRGGNIVGPCEREGRKKVITDVVAGDRLKVGWTSNNHAGGWVRLSLVPEGKHKVYEHFEQNTLKIVCYGHDERKGGTSYGDCIHPCNTRPGCEYMANKYDSNRYDTTIKIPFNLAEGVYILQYMSAMSAHKTFYYSCARLRIKGGKPSLPCKRTGLAPVAYKCMKGTAVSLDKYQVKTKMGDFCFSPKGLGDQDADMNRVPINPDCDPRITCQLSVNNKRCMSEDRMADITNAGDPKQVCTGEIVPPPEPTCDDKIKNNGEQMVDCGGPNCEACYEEPTEPIDSRIYSDLKYTEKVQLEQGLMEVRAVITVSKAASDWRFAIFLDHPVKWRHFWNCKLISKNDYDTVWTFGPMPWTKKIKPGQKIQLGFNGNFEADGEAPQTVTKSFVEYPAAD